MPAPAEHTPTWRCAGPSCPGLPWAPSGTRPHPLACNRTPRAETPKSTVELALERLLRDLGSHDGDAAFHALLRRAGLDDGAAPITMGELEPLEASAEDDGHEIPAETLRPRITSFRTPTVQDVADALAELLHPFPRSEQLARVVAGIPSLLAGVGPARIYDAIREALDLDVRAHRRLVRAAERLGLTRTADAMRAHLRAAHGEG